MNTNKSFMDPVQVLDRAELRRGMKVLDLGAGSGHFAIAAAQMVGHDGQVVVVDVLEQALEHVGAEARIKRLRNIKTMRKDLEQGQLPEIESGFADCVILANVLHQLKNQDKLFAEIYRVLKTSGTLLVIDWNGKPTPIGPRVNERISEDDIKNQALETHLKFLADIPTDAFHYGMLFEK
ncbi:MAG: class I SAM-dependent methyltransferase [Candidatus Doudnabacteria bacterium]|nr:class I SAM-dependent methyltransferase [Candidatus Doudnabacteria bacterium]